MFVRHIKIVQLLLLYCIVQSYVLCDTGSVPTQLKAESEISRKTAGLTKNEEFEINSKYAPIVRWLNIRKAAEKFLTHQKALSMLEKEADNSRQKDRETIDTGKENMNIRDKKFNWKPDNRRVTDEREQSLKRKINQKLIDLFLGYLLFPVKILDEIIVQTTKPYVVKLIGLSNPVKDKLKFMDGKPTSTKSSNHSIISPIVKESESPNNDHQTVEHRMSEIHNVNNDSVDEDNPSSRESIDSHRNKRGINRVWVPKVIRSTTVKSRRRQYVP